MAQLDECIDRLSTISIDTNRFLRLIRQLDKKLEQQLPKLAERQKEFVDKARLLKQRKQDMRGLDQEYNKIVEQQKLYYGMGLQKVRIAQQLQQLLNDHVVQINNKLKSQVKIEKLQEDMKDDKIQIPLKKKKFKTQSKIMIKGQKKQSDKQWLYDKYSQVYCYCGQGSFGQMFACQYPFCERQWFHKQCINEKISEDQQWFCADCRKLRQTMNNNSMKNYLK